ncbi:MAG: hypothetical protein V3U13_02105 [Gemmatimonadota bacterium]
MNWSSEVLGLLGLGKKSLLESWADRLLRVAEQAAGSLEGATDRAAEAAESARRRTGPYLREARERARAGALAGREALSERADAISRRTAEFRERRDQRRAARRETRRRRRPPHRAPMQLDLRRDDRIILRSRRPVDLRLSDGGVIRYRYYERPSFAQRAYLHLTGRQIWPPRRLR